MTHNIKLELDKPQSKKKLDQLLHTSMPVTFDLPEDRSLSIVGENYSATMTVNQVHVALMKVQYVDEPDQTD